MKDTYLKHLLIAVGVWSFALNAAGSTAAQEVKVVQASPASLILKMGQQTTLQPQPLSPAQKLLAAQSVANRQGKKAGSLGSSLMLSPTKLMAGSASLTLAYPAFVRSGSVIFLVVEKKAAVLVTFRPPAAGLYLLDFTIGTSGVRYKLSASNAAHVSAMPTKGHLLFVTDVTTPNQDIHFELDGESNWTFLSCEITQIK